MKSLEEWVALARAKPNTLNVAAAAGNSDLILTSFAKTQNLPVARVPYRDIQQAPNDLAENRIQLLMSSYATMMRLVQAGKIRVLAVTSRKRVDVATDVPTVAEAGFPYLGHGQPDRHVRSARDDERVAGKHRGGRPGRGRGRSRPSRSRLAATGQVIDLRGPAEFAAGIKDIRDQLADIAKVLGIKAAQQAQ